MPIRDKLLERKLSNNQVIIGKFVESPASDKHFWPREMKLVKKLSEIYTIEFLLWVTPPNFKAKSLAVYLGDWGKKFLSAQLFEFKKNVSTSITPEKPIIEKEKIGQDIILGDKKPKTLKDFLNLFN